MACVLYLCVISLTLLATLTGGTRQYDALDKKINAVKDMMEVEIDMIKQDLAVVVKNLSMSAVGEVQGKNGNVNTLQIASTMGEDLKNKIQAAEYVYKVIQRGFSSEKMSLRKSVSMIEQSVAHVQLQLEDVKEDLANIARSVMKQSETLEQLQLHLSAEISENKRNMEAKVEQAKQDAILKEKEDRMISKIRIAVLNPHKYRNSIYFQLNGAEDYSDGLKRCHQYGAHLPEVTSSEENAFLIRTFNQPILLGAIDVKTEGHFVWGNTGQAVRFADWASGEPNDINNGEDCVEIKRSKWNDIFCSNTLNIVCEFDI